MVSTLASVFWVDGVDAVGPRVEGMRGMADGGHCALEFWMGTLGTLCCLALKMRYFKGHLMSTKGASVN